MTKQLAIFVNMEAGGAGKKILDEVNKACRDADLTYRIVETGDEKTAEDAASQAIDEGTKQLCACGGDGTVAQVVNAILKSGRKDLVLSVMPMGTGNLIAEAMGIPCGVAPAVKVIREGHVREIDAGKIDDSYFVLGLGIGATERFVTQTPDAAKKRFGRVAYAVSLFRQTDSPLCRLKVEVDGKERAAARVQAATLANFWGTSRVNLLAGSSPDDGKMEIVVNDRLTRWGIVRLAWDGLLGRLRQDKDVTVYQGKKFSIRTEPSLPVQLDGNESELKTPIQVKVLHRALKVVAPAK